MFSQVGGETIAYDSYHNHLMIPVDEGAVMRKSTTPRDVSSLDKGDYSDKHCIYVFFFTFNKLFL